MPDWLPLVWPSSWGIFPATVVLYQDICRLVMLMYPSAEVSLITHVAKEAFVAVLNDGRLQLEVMKCELQNVEAVLSRAIKLEAYEQSLPAQLKEV